MWLLKRIWNNYDLCLKFVLGISFTTRMVLYLFMKHFMVATDITTWSIIYVFIIFTKYHFSFHTCRVDCARHLSKKFSLIFDGPHNLIGNYLFIILHWLTWWRHRMKTFPALLAIYAGNSPVPGNSRHEGQWRGALMFSLICVWINGWVNNGKAGDLRRYRAHYDVTVMNTCQISSHPFWWFDGSTTEW